MTTIDLVFDDVRISFTALRASLAISRSRLAHAGFARVAPDDLHQRVVVDRPLARLQAVSCVCSGIRWRLAISSFSSSV